MQLHLAPLAGRGRRRLAGRKAARLSRLSRTFSILAENTSILLQRPPLGTHPDSGGFRTPLCLLPQRQAISSCALNS
jgi:hypothetical protein